MSVIAIVHFVNYKKGTQSRAALRGVLFYVMQARKTTWAGEKLFSGINCQPQSACDDFLKTKLLYHKGSGVMFYHMVQSFPKGETVTPRKAHEAARRLAAESFKGCEVLVCTHVDREHIHSHCIINSVNFETGKKLHMAKEQLQELMQRNDAICQELGLPVFQSSSHRHARGMDGAEYHVALKGQSWKLRLANIVDECMRYAGNRAEFISLMESEGCTVRWENNRRSITYTTPDGKKCRDNKLHEDKYLKEVMEHEFRIRAELIQRKSCRADEVAEGIEETEPSGKHWTEQHTESSTAYCDSVSAAAGADESDAAGGRDTLGAGGDSKNAPRPEIPHQSDRSVARSQGSVGNTDADGKPVGTGWEAERAVFLQMAELASGFQSSYSKQVGCTDADNRRSGTNAVVRYGNDAPAVPLMPAVIGLTAAGTLLDEDEDSEEKQRRMEVKVEAENFGAVMGLAAGIAVAKQKTDELTEQKDKQQTMGGF